MKNHLSFNSSGITKTLLKEARLFSQKKFVPDDKFEAKFLNDIAKKVSNFYYLFHKLLYYINIFKLNIILCYTII